MLNHHTTIKHSLIWIMAFHLSSCATLMLNELTGKTVHTTYYWEKVYSDDIISYGIPSIAIKDYEYAIAMAGKNYSYLVKPATGKDNVIEKTLFRDFLNHLDIRYLAFTTDTSAHGVNENDTLRSIRDINFRVENKQINRTSLNFLFLKPVLELKPNEQKQLEAYNFKCSIEKISQEQTKDFLYCKRKVVIDILVAEKAKNTNQLTNTFRESLHFNFYQKNEQTKINPLKVVLFPLYPVAVSYDIVTAPITLGAAYIYFDVMGNSLFKF